MRLSKTPAPSIPSKTTKPTRPAKVTMDNGPSDFFTLIQIFVDDRGGLQFTITNRLFNHRPDTRTAKIATKTNQVADVLCVRDFEGQKVEGNDQELEIKRALLHQLKQG